MARFATLLPATARRVRCPAALGRPAARVLLLAAALFLCLPPAYGQAPRDSARAAAADAALTDVQPVKVDASPIRRFDRVSDQKQFGRLVFRGGLVLTSSAKAFGGFSGLAVDADGRRLLMVSDETGWLSGEIVYDGVAPTGIRDAHMGPIRAIAGRTLDRKRDADAEAITLIDGTLKRGTVLIAFERNHRIGRFPVVDGALQAPTGYLKLPPEARRMRQNKGFESIAVLQGGPYKGSPISFSERFPDSPATHTGWIWVKGEPQRIAITASDDFEVTDAASLADGSLLVLERRFRWSDWLQGVRTRLRRFAANDIRPGHTPAGEILLEADLAKEIDNMEGLAIHRGAQGETVLTLISDNNFSSFLQRTLLLQFALLDGTSQATRP